MEEMVPTLPSLAFRVTLRVGYFYPDGKAMVFCSNGCGRYARHELLDGIIPYTNQDGESDFMESVELVCHWCYFLTKLNNVLRLKQGDGDIAGANQGDDV